MPGIEAEMEIRNLEKVQAKLEREALLGGPVRHILGQTALTIERKAKQFSPVDTGRLRASITPIVDTRSVPLWAKVGTDVDYAESVNSPKWKGPRPGGVGRKQFFTAATEETWEKVQELLDKARRMIEEEWEK